MKEVKLYLNYAGFCYANESHSIKGGANQTIKFHALYGLIFHPEKGWILYDTGYTRRFYDFTKSYPNKIYANLTKVVINEEEEICNQLKQFNLVAEDIKHVFITHFHADHIGGLKDFQSATFYCSKVAYKQMDELHPLLGFTKGLLKDLIPADFHTRLQFVEDFAICTPDALFGTKYDLFGDQSLIAYSLPGHAAGQMGVQIKTQKGHYFLIADACWNKQSYIDLRLPPSIVRLFFDSWKDFKESLQKIHAFHQQYPKVIIVPTHCSETTHNLISHNYDLDAL